MSFNEKIILNDGRQMPLLGLGVYKAVGENEVEQRDRRCRRLPATVSLTPTSVYKNEDGVGRGIKLLPYQERNYSLQRKYGIPHRESATWKILSTEVWSAWDLIMWIYI